MSGRPQSYIGALEDRVVETQSIGHDLACRHDPVEFGTLRDQGRVLVEVLDRMAFDAPLRPLVAQALEMNHRLQLADVDENRAHRVIAGVS